VGGEGESFRVDRPGERQKGEARRREEEGSRVREEAVGEAGERRESNAI
jgi:hypothetical protein